MTLVDVLIAAVVAGLILLVVYLWSRQGEAGYDLEGNLRYLSGRNPAKHDWFTTNGQPIAPATVDDTLMALCESFDIPPRQKDLLRPDDTMKALYRHILGPRSWDDLQPERLGMRLNRMIGRPISEEEWRTIMTVGDLVRFVAAHRLTESSAI